MIHLYKSTPPAQPKLSKQETEFVDLEIQKLLEKCVIEESKHEVGEYLSSIFLRPKKDGSYRMILNLKPLNEHIVYRHFKMDTIQTVIHLIEDNVFMASLDLQDAYYSVPIAEQYQKFLKFKWNGKLYQYLALPMGLASAPRIFTKIMKPIFSYLRQQGFISSGYIDDIFLMGETYQQCLMNVENTLKILFELGFVINTKKSVLQPQQQLSHLGFDFNSETMIIKLPREKSDMIKEYATLVLSKNVMSIRMVAKLVGLFISAIPAVENGALYYRNIEREKIIALKFSKGDYEQSMSLSKVAQTDIMWWCDKLPIACKSLNNISPSLMLRTDASLSGWGAVLTHDNIETGGRWSIEEGKNHINVLELKAAYLGLKSLCSNLSNISIKLEMDNTTAVAYIKNKGGGANLLNATMSQEKY